MKPTQLFLRVYGERKKGQWFLIALDFDLAVQSDDLEDAKKRLHAQVREYLFDALAGEDRAHAAQLLTRRSPFKYQAKFWFFSRLSRLKRALLGRPAPAAAGHKAYEEAVPMVPACGV